MRLGAQAVDESGRSLCLTSVSLFLFSCSKHLDRVPSCFPCKNTDFSQMILAEAEIKAQALGSAQRWLCVLEVPLLCAARCGQGFIGVLDHMETLPLLHGVRESLKMEPRWVCWLCSRGGVACPPDACEQGSGCSLSPAQCSGHCPVPR